MQDFIGGRELTTKNHILNFISNCISKHTPLLRALLIVFQINF